MGQFIVDVGGGDGQNSIRLISAHTVVGRRPDCFVPRKMPVSLRVMLRANADLYRKLGDLRIYAQISQFKASLAINNLVNYDINGITSRTTDWASEM